MPTAAETWHRVLFRTDAGTYTQSTKMATEYLFKQKNETNRSKRNGTTHDELVVCTLHAIRTHWARAASTGTQWEQQRTKTKPNQQQQQQRKWGEIIL